VRDHDDITIVTINYRTKIFGQPNAPQLVTSTQAQNFGLLNTDAAVNWVHSDIGWRSKKNHDLGKTREASLLMLTHTCTHPTQL
jgi:hypothetical protein